MAESFTTGQIARFSSVNINVVKKWITDGLLSAYRLPAGHYRINQDAYLSFLKKNRLPLPDELAHQQKNNRVLIIDDDLKQNTMLEDFFHVRGQYEVQSAGDGYEGLIKIGSFQPGLIFLDISMPNLDGFEFLDALQHKTEQPHPKIVVITGHKDEETVLKLKRRAIFDLVFKPYSLKLISVLLEKIEART